MRAYSCHESHSVFAPHHIPLRPQLRKTPTHTLQLRHREAARESLRICRRPKLCALTKIHTKKIAIHNTCTHKYIYVLFVARWVRDVTETSK